MKGRRILILVAVCLFIGCTKPTNEITISGTIIGDIPEKIVLTVPIQGVSFWGFTDTIFPDSLGHFKFSTISDKPSLIALFGFGLSYGYNTFDYILVEPGKDYRLVLDLTAEKAGLMINENSCKAQTLLASFPQYGHPQLDDLWQFCDSSVSVIRNTVLERQHNEIGEINKLYGDNMISDEVADLLIQTRTMYYSNAMCHIASLKYLTPLFQGQEFSDEEALELWNEARMSLSPEDKYFFSSHLAFDFLNSSLWYKIYSTLGYKKAGEIQREYIDKGLRHTRNLEAATTYLEPKTLEFYKAAYLYFHAFQKRYEKELIPLFEEYRTSFPGSQYSSYHISLIDEIKNFHTIAEKEFSEDMHFLEDYAEITTFNELMSNFQGRKVYVDIWATTCGHCKREFNYSAELKEFLESEGIQMLYISLDRDHEDEQWKNMVKYYNLEGFHIRVNPDLSHELQNLLSVGGIPHYALIDENGKVIIQSAHRPSDLEQLANQIRSI